MTICTIYFKTPAWQALGTALNSSEWWHCMSSLEELGIHVETLRIDPPAEISGKISVTVRGTRNRSHVSIVGLGNSITEALENVDVRATARFAPADQDLPY